MSNTPSADIIIDELTGLPMEGPATITISLEEHAENMKTIEDLTKAAHTDSLRRQILELLTCLHEGQSEQNLRSYGEQLHIAVDDLLDHLL